jgi:large subunit ribosomal protein L10
MAITRSKKENQLKILTDLITSAQGVAFVTFNEASVEEVQQIRRDLRASEMTYTVIKKTLIKLAVKNAKNIEVPLDNLAGSVAVITSSADELAPLAIIKKMKKESLNKATKTSKFNFAGSLFDGEFLDQSATAIMADVPSREESLGRIVGALRSGPNKIHGILKNGLQGIYTVLQDADKFASKA